MKIVKVHAPHLVPKPKTKDIKDDSNVVVNKIPITPKREILREPTLTEMATSFIEATSRWSSAGFPIVNEEIYKSRSSICESCEFWDGKARFGLGKCKAIGCGCTKFKRWIQTEKCPKNKWNE